MKIENLINEKWYTEDPPWGDGTCVLAGDPDPHAGTLITSVDWISPEGFTTDDAAALAAHIVEAHNLIQVYEKLYLAARDLLELAEFCDDDQMLIHQDNHDAMAEALRAVYQEKLKAMGPPATRAEHNRRMMREY